MSVIEEHGNEKIESDHDEIEELDEEDKTMMMNLPNGTCFSNYGLCR